MYCSQCGSENKEDAKFCIACGAPLRTGEQNGPGEHTSVVDVSSTLDSPPDVQETVSAASVSHESEGARTEEEHKKYEESMNGSGFPLLAWVSEKGRAAIIGALAVVVVLAIMLFTNFTLFVICAGGLFIIYQGWFADPVMRDVYARMDHSLQLPKGSTGETLFQALTGQFNYPNFQSAHVNAEGQCVISGKYGKYIIDETDSMWTLLIENELPSCVTIREAIAVRSYLDKFFNPTLPYDPEKSMEHVNYAAKAARVVKIADVAILALIVLMVLARNGIFTTGSTVRNGYLTGYSSTVTVGKAFDNFFANPQWSSTKTGDTEYVIFTGQFLWDGEPADARITFDVRGDSFSVSDIDVNGMSLDILGWPLLEAVYEDYSSDDAIYSKSHSAATSTLVPTQAPTVKSTPAAADDNDHFLGQWYIGQWSGPEEDGTSWLKINIEPSSANSNGYTITGVRTYDEGDPSFYQLSAVEDGDDLIFTGEDGSGYGVQGTIALGDGDTPNVVMSLAHAKTDYEIVMWFYLDRV